MKLIAPAKINLFLSVGARRADGHHELVSVMQAVSLYDELTLSAAPSFSLEVRPEEVVPAGDGNLALRAARAFALMQGLPGAAHLSLHKTIPVAAGLAGGSADAAAALVGCNKLWDARLSKKALEKIGAGLGADVPFCVRGGCAAARGAGEDLTSLSLAAPVWWVLGIAGSGLSTAEVYAEYDRLGGGVLGDPFEVADALARGDLERLAGALRNDLERAALSLSPSLASGREALLRAGALGAIISGSGPTWIGLARDEAHAHVIAAAARDAFARVEVAHSVDHGPKIVER